MAGHSKWAQIKRKKALNDSRRGQIFSRISRLITIAARKGQDPKSNVSLSQAIDQAKSYNMPSENIDRAIRKVSDKDSQNLQELSISAIGPDGVAIIIKAITDNSNRTISEIKKILTDNNSKLVPPGSIDWLFKQPPRVISDQNIIRNLDLLLESLDNHDDVEDVVININ